MAANTLAVMVPLLALILLLHLAAQDLQQTIASLDPRERAATPSEKSDGA